MARYSKQDVEESTARLRAMLKPGSTVYTKVDHVARSGMTRWIECYIPARVARHAERDWTIHNITHDVAVVTGSPLNTRDHYGVEVGGCGMDMGFALIYSLSSVLYRDGFRCAGRSCGSNDHSNPRNRGTYNYETREYDGYIGPMPRDGRSKHRGDGGYALNQRWM